MTTTTTTTIFLGCDSIEVNLVLLYYCKLLKYFDDSMIALLFGIIVYEILLSGFKGLVH